MTPADHKVGTDVPRNDHEVGTSVAEMWHKVGTGVPPETHESGTNVALETHALGTDVPESWHARSTYQYQYQRTTKTPSQDEGVFASLTLRPYQSAAIDKLRSGLAGGVLRELLYSPTGSGKTEMGMALIKGAMAKHKRVAFLCNRIGLVQQTSKRFLRAGISHGIVQGQNTARVYERVLIVSIQTAVRRGLPECDLLIIDEAHGMAGSKDYRRVIAKAKCPVVGLSATPFAKGLGKHYEGMDGPLFQSMVIAATIPELIADGYLVDVDVYAPSEPDMSEVRKRHNAFGEVDFSDADAGRAADKPQLVGDIVTHWMRLARGTATVCFASSIAHSMHIVERFLGVGVSAEHIDCYADDDERAAILRRVESGETLVVSNVGILAEGWDFPACQTMILARPTRSLTRYIQMAGRVLRPHPSKVRALILDHSGTATRLGLPTDDFPIELDDGKPREAGAAKASEPVLPMACPSCSYLKFDHKCPQCGFAPAKQAAAVPVAAGDLVKVTGKRKAPKLEKQDFYSQLQYIANCKNYEAGWVSHKFRAYYGVWPVGLDRVAAAGASTEVKNFLKHLNIKHGKGKGADHARR
jgi:superfamily II DNA or RNA helicase